MPVTVGVSAGRAVVRASPLFGFGTIAVSRLAVHRFSAPAGQPPGYPLSPALLQFLPSELAFCASGLASTSLA